MRHKSKKFTMNNAAEESFQKIKTEQCEAPVLGMSTEKGMYVLECTIGGSDLRDTPPRTGVEREDSFEKNILREPSLE